MIYRVVYDEVIKNMLKMLKMECEPELSEVPLVDKVLVRNILYAAWALQEVDQSCISWNVQSKTWGYVINMSFSKNFSISLSDMQLIKELSSLRIENVMVRNGDKPSINDVVIGAVLIVKLLNQDQPVTFTEAEVVRLRKRHRGWFSTE
jgi:hypothetical protein